jgi:hypothetical protein
MSPATAEALIRVLEKIDRPGTFCASGSVPAVLPGLEVAGLGPVGLPLTAAQAEQLKGLCERAPYGKGEETLVDTNVRRVWELKPDRFSLTNPDWERFVMETVRTVQQDLGLEKQKLESHLYDLLLYEPGSFFLPHRDGEKLNRMVATLVLVLPSSFQGGELVVRHEDEERTIDFGGENPFHIHFAAFYADCEHEIRPLREGYRLCLVYNLTLAKAKNRITAPRTSQQVEEIAAVLGRWAQEEDAPHKLVVALGYQYTEAGLTWDALKGVDRAQAQALAEGARRAGCRAYLALLTLYQSGSAEGGYDDYHGRRRRRWYEEDDEEEETGAHEMGEIYESSLTADHWSDPEGNPLPVGELNVEEDELLDPDILEEVQPEEEFEGYTGNEGMTLERWYHHAAIIIWPNERHFQVLCDAGPHAAVPALAQMVKQLEKAGPEEAAVLRAGCLDFAGAIIARWPESPYDHYIADRPESSSLFRSLAALDEPALIKAYLTDVLPRDPTVDAGKALATVCRKHGWGTFQAELVSALEKATPVSLARDVRLLEPIFLARPHKDAARAELCQALGSTFVAALERIDQMPAAHDWRVRQVNRGDVLTRLILSLLAAGQEEQLARVVAHTMARPAQYPLHTVHLAALSTLQPWLGKHFKKRSQALADWVAACRGRLEALTVQEPQPPADFRRAAPTSCTCADCAELRRFLEDPNEREHRFRAPQDRRTHLEEVIRQNSLDVDRATERRGSPHTLVCRKNTQSYQAALKTYRHDLELLAMVRAIEAKLPK